LIDLRLSSLLIGSFYHWTYHHARDAARGTDQALPVTHFSPSPRSVDLSRQQPPDPSLAGGAAAPKGARDLRVWFWLPVWRVRKLLNSTQPGNAVFVQPDPKKQSPPKP